MRLDFQEGVVVLTPEGEDEKKSVKELIGNIRGYKIPCYAFTRMLFSVIPDKEVKR